MVDKNNRESWKRGFYADAASELEPEGWLRMYLDGYASDRRRSWEERPESEECPSPQILYEQSESVAASAMKLLIDLAPAVCPGEEPPDLRKELAEHERRMAAHQQFVVSLLLQNPQSLSPGQIMDAIRSGQGNLNLPQSVQLVWEKLWIALSSEAISEAGSSALRLLNLWTHMVVMNVSERTRAYLTRVVRCYVFGFEAECIILCRSVLEAAFSDVVTPEMCEEILGPRKDDSFEFADRIGVAQNRKLISEGAAKKAHEVRLRGNKAVHYDPDLTQDVDGTVRRTINVLKELTSRK